MPIIRPVSSFTRRTTSSGRVSGRPTMRGSHTSNIFKSSRSAPMEAANSALVTSLSSGGMMPMVSAASTRPSLPATACSSSFADSEASSAGSRSSTRFVMMIRSIPPPVFSGQLMFSREISPAVCFKYAPWAYSCQPRPFSHGKRPDFFILCLPQLYKPVSFLSLCRKISIFLQHFNKINNFSTLDVTVVTL